MNIVLLACGVFSGVLLYVVTRNGVHVYLCEPKRYPVQFAGWVLFWTFVVAVVMIAVSGLITPK